MEPAEVQQAAREKLGGLRHWVRAELRGLPGLLQEGEPVRSMALASLGALGVRGRLLVATDRRLILTHKYPLRPQRVEAIPYERLQLISAEPGKLRVTIDDKQLRLNIIPADRAPELARLLEGHAPGHAPGRATTIRDRKPVARGLVGAIVAGLLGYLAAYFLGFGQVEEMRVGHCTDGSHPGFNRVSCEHPDALFKLVRQVESETDCRKFSLIQEGPARFPWVGDKTFCARRVSSDPQRR